MAGLPVVASEFREIRQIVYADELGLLVPSDDTEALAPALRRMVEDRGLRDAFASNARNATDRLNWEAQEHLLVEIYAGLGGVGSHVRAAGSPEIGAASPSAALSQADHQ